MITTDPDAFARQTAQTYPLVGILPASRFDALTPVVRESQETLLPARWPRWMKKADVAEYLSVSPRTIDKWVRTAVLPPAMVFGDHLKRWDRLELDQHLDRRTGHGSSDGNNISDLLNAYASQQGRGEI